MMKTNILERRGFLMCIHCTATLLVAACTEMPSSGSAPSLYDAAMNETSRSVNCLIEYKNHIACQNSIHSATQ